MRISDYWPAGSSQTYPICMRANFITSSEKNEWMIDNCIGRSCVSLALVEIQIYPFGVNELHQTLVKIKEIKIQQAKWGLDRNDDI